MPTLTNPNCPGSIKCPYFHNVMGKCFNKCGYPNSPNTCGECAHWLGDYTYNDRQRHKLHGSCFHCVGKISSRYQCNCEHFTKHKPEEPNWYDWVEARVIELGGAHDSSPNSRKLRKQARKEWAEAHN